jgi:tRNA(fMet)-specific endonuclease VapC
LISHVLDANAAIALIGGKSATFLSRAFARPPGAVALPTIVAHELYFGAFKSQRAPFNLEMLRLLIADTPILDFTLEDARTSGELRATLAAFGTPIGPYDVLIAGQAKARGLTVVTNNVREFSRVAGLRVEDWTL